MKTPILISASLILALSNLTQAQAEVVTIKGMHCGGCAKSIEMTLCKLPELKECKVEMGKATIAVKDGSNLNKDAVMKAVKEAGYEVTEIK